MPGMLGRRAGMLGVFVFFCAFVCYAFVAMLVVYFGVFVFLDLFILAGFVGLAGITGPVIYTGLVDFIDLVDVGGPVFLSRCVGGYRIGVVVVDVVDICKNLMNISIFDSIIVNKPVRNAEVMDVGVVLG